jgi:hypothetical protein
MENENKHKQLKKPMDESLKPEDKVRARRIKAYHLATRCILL